MTGENTLGLNCMHEVFFVFLFVCGLCIVLHNVKCLCCCLLTEGEVEDVKVQSVIVVSPERLISFIYT